MIFLYYLMIKLIMQYGVIVYFAQQGKSMRAACYLQQLF